MQNFQFDSGFFGEILILSFGLIVFDNFNSNRKELKVCNAPNSLFEIVTFIELLSSFYKTNYKNVHTNEKTLEIFLIESYEVKPICIWFTRNKDHCYFSLMN